MLQSEADFVIVGAGSAGCVLADRLTEDPSVKVVLLEAGGDDRPMRNPSQFFLNTMIHVAAGFVHTRMNPKTSWNYITDPDATCQDRAHAWPRGKVLGGSSSINGMVYVRGQRADYDGWRQMGCDGWAWDDVEPYFKRAERHEFADDEHCGQTGPLHVTETKERNAVGDALIAACEQAGIPRNANYNGATQEGAGYFQSTLRKGQRCSTATAYLHPAMKRPNLSVVTGAFATRILFEGKRAVGVEYTRNGLVQQVRAKREVILSGGAINSPQLLQLSGIGPGHVLQNCGIETLVDSPGVGENLQDHVMTMATFRLKPGSYSLNARTHAPRLWWEVLRYALTRQGLLAQSVAHLTVFARSRAELSNPDLQFAILAATLDLEEFKRNHRMKMEKLPGLTISPCQLQPESRGSIHIKSPDPKVHPQIHANYLADPIDQQTAVAALRLTRKIIDQPALQKYVEHEMLPGNALDSDENLLAYAKATSSSGYHPVGTCAMGIQDKSVLDPQLRVRGVDGLRVVDASVMPRISSGNTNGPTIMIAERAADLILQRRQA